MSFKVNKKTLVRRKSIVVVHFVRFEKTLHVVCIMVTIFLVFQKQYFLSNNTQNRWEIIIYKHVKSKKSCTKRDFLTVWFHPPVLQGPFTTWLNNKLK